MPYHDTSSSAYSPAPLVTNVQPLAQHPQLQVIQSPLSFHSESSGTHIEYRAYNYRYLPSGRLVRGDGWNIWAIMLSLALGWLIWGEAIEGKLSLPQGCIAGVLDATWLYSMIPAILLVCVQTRTVLYRKSFRLFLCQMDVDGNLESVIPLRGLGLQLSTTRGISLPYPPKVIRHGVQDKERPAPSRLLLPLLSSSTFIPLSEISTIVINEGIRRWSVRYYLGIIKRGEGGIDVALDVSASMWEVTACADMSDR
jgi:phosphatidylinositol glycan class H protein